MGLKTMQVEKIDDEGKEKKHAQAGKLTSKQLDALYYLSDVTHVGHALAVLNTKMY